MADLTVEDIRRCVVALEDARVKPLVVRSRWQALLMTLRDPSGHRWRKGDEYYWACRPPDSHPEPTKGK